MQPLQDNFARIRDIDGRFQNWMGLLKICIFAFKDGPQRVAQEAHASIPQAIEVMPELQGDTWKSNYEPA